MKAQKSNIRLKVLKNVFIYGLLGALLWVLLGRLFFPSIPSLICFIGYPAIFIGFYWTLIQTNKKD